MLSFRKIVIAALLLASSNVLVQAGRHESNPVQPTVEPAHISIQGGSASSQSLFDPNDTPPPFRKLMAANRGEIATRIFRAASELGIPTVGIYSYPDRFTQHRYKCDQSFALDYRSKTPVAQYLDVPTIVKLCVQNGVEAVHPGYG